MDVQLRHDGSETGKEFAQLWAEVGRRQDENLATCIAMLRRGYNVAAVHPDDGWVDRKANVVTFCYPGYRREIRVGDRLALGHHTCDEQVIGHYRIVRVTEIGKPGLLSGESPYSFVEEVPTFEMTAAG